MTKATKEPTKLQKDWIRCGSKEGWRTWSTDEKTTFLLSAVVDQKNWLEWLHKDILLDMTKTLVKIATALDEHQKALIDIREVTEHNTGVLKESTVAVAETVGEICEAVGDLGEIVNHNAAAAHMLTEMLGVPSGLGARPDDLVKPPNLDEEDEDAP